MGFCNASSLEGIQNKPKTHRENLICNLASRSRTVELDYLFIYLDHELIVLTVVFRELRVFRVYVLGRKPSCSGPLQNVSQ
jgi:hypothetical protein